MAATLGGATHLDPASLHAAGGDAVYMNEPTEVTRLRALTGPDGKPETTIYDDLGVGVNQEATTGPHVWWKEIRALDV